MASPYEVETMPAGDLTYLCGVTVSLQFGKDKTKHYCRCRGVSPSKFLVFQTPSSVDRRVDMGTGAEVIVRYVHSGTVMGFRAEIVQSQERPFRLIFTVYPQSIERYQLRSCERADVILQADYTMAGHTAGAVIRDLSCGGCRLEVDASVRGDLLSKGDDQAGYLSFSTDVFDEMVSVECRIIRIRADKHKTELGLEFDASDTQAIDKITQYVDHILDIQA